MRDRSFPISLACTIWLCAVLIWRPSFSQPSKDTLPVFSVAGTDSNGLVSETEWEGIPWQMLVSLDTLPDPYPTRFRMLHSAKGIHVKIHGRDRKVTSAYLNDGEELYLGDVFEVFLHPEPSTPLYFEYEVNAHGRELVLLIPNLGGRLLGWLPWRYEDGRKVIKRVLLEAGPREMTGWSAELFIPFALLSPLKNTPPDKGTVWHVNVCRLDYDAGRMMKWSWSPVKNSFHEYRSYRPIRFE